MNQYNGRDWSLYTPPLDTKKNDIDRMAELEKYTDYEFSTTDKIKGSYHGAKKQAIKDFNSLFEKTANYGNYIKQGVKVITILFIINIALTTFTKVKKWKIY